MAHDSFEEDYELANGHTGIGAVARQFHNQMMERKDAEIEKLKGQRDKLALSLRNAALDFIGANGTSPKWWKDCADIVKPVLVRNAEARSAIAEIEGGE